MNSMELPDESGNIKMFDSHAHYFDEKFNTLLGGADALLSDREFEKNICGVVNVATNHENALECIRQSKKYDFMYNAVGIHPEDAQGMGKDEMHRQLGLIKELISDSGKRKENKTVAIGEIGFDYYWEPVDKQLQRECFISQLELASKCGCPIIVHDRDAHKDTFDMLMDRTDVRGIIHSCSLSSDMALLLAKKGYYISFSGTLTFKNARRVKECCAALPLECLLIETDAPYLAPHPHRGEINNSRLMRYTLEELAALHNVKAEHAARVLCKNASDIFEIEM